MALCSSISALIAKKCKNEVSYDEVISIIKSDYSSLSEVSDLIVKNLISEQIIVRDSANARMLRFRHMKFVEYLTSYYIARTLNTSNDPKKLDEMISSLINESFLSIYYIHEFIRSICKAEFYDLYENLMEHYSESSEYMKRLVHQKDCLYPVVKKLVTLTLIRSKKRWLGVRARFVGKVFCYFSEE